MSIDLNDAVALRQKLHWLRHETRQVQRYGEMQTLLKQFGFIEDAAGGKGDHRKWVHPDHADLSFFFDHGTNKLDSQRNAADACAEILRRMEFELQFKQAAKSNQTETMPNMVGVDGLDPELAKKFDISEHKNGTLYLLNDFAAFGVFLTPGTPVQAAEQTLNQLIERGKDFIKEIHKTRNQCALFAEIHDHHMILKSGLYGFARELHEFSPGKGNPEPETILQDIRDETERRNKALQPLIKEFMAKLAFVQGEKPKKDEFPGFKAIELHIDFGIYDYRFSYHVVQPDGKIAVSMPEFVMQEVASLCNVFFSSNYARGAGFAIESTESTKRYTHPLYPNVQGDIPRMQRIQIPQELTQHKMLELSLEDQERVLKEALRAFDQVFEASGPMKDLLSAFHQSAIKARDLMAKHRNPNATTRVKKAKTGQETRATFTLKNGKSATITCMRAKTSVDPNSVGFIYSLPELEQLDKELSAEQPKAGKAFRPAANGLLPGLGGGSLTKQDRGTSNTELPILSQFLDNE